MGGVKGGDEGVGWRGRGGKWSGAEKFVSVFDLDVTFDADDCLPAWGQGRVSRGTRSGVVGAGRDCFGFALLFRCCCGGRAQVWDA